MSEKRSNTGKKPVKKRLRKREAIEEIELVSSDDMKLTAPVPKPKVVWMEPKAPWPGMRLIAHTAGVHSVTCVDPGTRNLAIMRMQFYPSLEITHATVVDLHQLCAQMEVDKKDIRLRSEGGAIDRSSVQRALATEPTYMLDTLLFALTNYVKEQSVGGGIFNSDMLFVEEQSFDRVMARVEATLVSAYNVCKDDDQIIRILPGEGASIARAQTITANSVKACYAPFFPLVAKDESEPKTAFGVGDAHRGRDSKQRQMNKKMVTKFGSLILPQDRIGLVVEKLPVVDQERFAKKKMDDIYDVLFMCGYAFSTYILSIAKTKSRGVSRSMPLHQTFPQRLNSCFEELREMTQTFNKNDQMALDDLAEQLFGEK
jgi:hypothetical protein